MISAASPYTTWRRSETFDHADAGARRSAGPGDWHSDSVIFHFNHDSIVGGAAAQKDTSTLNFVRQAMLERVLHQRLQNHAGYQMVQRVRFEFLKDFEFVATEAHDFNIEIVVEELNLFAQGNKRITFTQEPP